VVETAAAVEDVVALVVVETRFGGRGGGCSGG
jgi:hypothetical protein